MQRLRLQQRDRSGGARQMKSDQSELDFNALQNAKSTMGKRPIWIERAQIAEN